MGQDPSDSTRRPLLSQQHGLGHSLPRMRRVFRRLVSDRGQASLDSRFHWLPKRWLVTGYIAIIGLLLSIGIVTQLLLAMQVGEMTILGPLSGMLPVVLFLTIGYWLTRSELDSDNVLAVAKWGGLAIAVLTLVNSAVIVVHRSITPVLTPGLTMLVSNIAIGGIIGLVFGWMRQLDHKARSRYRKSTVLNRTLRHDLRNDVNVVLGYLEVLERDLPDDQVDRLDPIRQRLTHLQSIGETARDLQAAVEETSAAGERIDAAGLLREQLDRFDRHHPDVELSADLPPTGWVSADEDLPVVFENIIENAIEHNEPPIRVSVASEDAERSDRLVVTIRDNGPGIPDSELAVLRNGHETPLEHCSGIGLWLVKWLVAGYDGDISFSTTDAGTTVRVELPRAPPDVGDQLDSLWQATHSTPR